MANKVKFGPLLKVKANNVIIFIIFKVIMANDLITFQIQ